MINEYIKLFLETNQTNKTFEDYLKDIAKRSRIENKKKTENTENTENTAMSAKEYIELLNYKAKP